MIQSPRKHESLLVRCWPALLIGGVWLWMFWPMMTGQSVVGFRDSAYLYYPMFKWIDSLWAAGEFPLWNPYCDFGMPVVADGSSSVFYPGKLMFFCRFLSYPARYGIYLAIHIPVAAAGAFWLARTLRANQVGATIAALSYAFGGSLLFQVTNVIFLVSAAWLPFAVCCVWKMVKTGQVRWAVAAGVTCALMILGGDPQMVYHVGLIAVATIVGEWVRRKRRSFKAKQPIKQSDFVWLFASGMRLGVMILITTVLAAVQLLPTYQWSQLSERTNPALPANVYQAWDSLKDVDRIKQIPEALLGDPMNTAEHSYQFSQPPWLLPELIWPNFSGKPFPRHQRWTSGLAGADRVWVPSLYVGLITVLLGALGFRFWGRRRKQVWLTYLFFFFMLGSFGWYGIVWLIVEIYPPLGLNTRLGPQVGGLYWLMNMLLPQYYAFRYPAKLFLIASLALSVLAGVNFRVNRLRLASWLCLIFVGLSGCGLVGFMPLIQAMFANVIEDSMFGRFDMLGAANDIRTTLVHSMIVGGFVFVLFTAIRRFANHQNANQKNLIRWASLALIVTLAMDVALSNRWLVPLVDASVFESENPVQTRLSELRAEIDGAEPLRIYRSPYDEFMPATWKQERSDDRLAEVIAWQRKTLYPKYHLGENVVLLGSFSSIWPATSQQWIELIEWYRGEPVFPDNQPVPVLKMFRGSLESDDDGSLSFKEFDPSQSLGNARPIEWMFEYDPEKETRSTRQPNCLWQYSPAEANVKHEDCRIVEFENSRFVAHVVTERPKVLAFFAPVDHGWKVTVQDLETDLSYPADLIELDDWVRGGASRFTNTLLLQFPTAGRFEVEFTYSPQELWIGAWVSGFSWAILIGGFVAVTLRNPKRRKRARIQRA